MIFSKLDIANFKNFFIVYKKYSSNHTALPFGTKKITDISKLRCQCICKTLLQIVFGHAGHRHG